MKNEKAKKTQQPTELSCPNCEAPIPAFLFKIRDLMAAGKLPGAGVVEVEVRHDDWCGVNRGFTCDCDADVRIVGSL